MMVKLARTPAIYLVGFMGCGKTTVGRLLAEQLGWSFVDLDAEIEAQQGRTIADIFDQEGEEHFRGLEAEALLQRVRLAQSGRPQVIALGGGAFARDCNFDLVEHNGVTVWLDCPLETAWRRVESYSDRPLARDRERFGALYQARRDCYARADFRVDAAGAAENVAEAVLALPLF
ncbi:MAG: shikimate kinase [Acidobacteria bacterium]|nr:shikimate kinase [Acidobacteriota bacterium]